jgi:hypothetical protein
MASATKSSNNSVQAFPDRVSAPDRPHQAFAFHQRRDAKARSLGASHGVGRRFTPAGMALGEIN